MKDSSERRIEPDGEIPCRGAAAGPEHGGVRVQHVPGWQRARDSLGILAEVPQQVRLQDFHVIAVGAGRRPDLVST